MTHLFKVKTATEPATGTIIHRMETAAVRSSSFLRGTTRTTLYFHPIIIQEIQIYNNSADDDRGRWLPEITEELKMPGSQLKEKVSKCLGQGHKNKENRETHTNS